MKTIRTKKQEEEVLKKIDDSYNGYVLEGVDYVKNNGVTDCYYLIRSNLDRIPKKDAYVDFFISKTTNSNTMSLKKHCTNCKKYDLSNNKCSIDLNPEYKYGKLVCKEYTQRLKNTSMFDSDNNRKPCEYHIGKYGVDYNVYLEHQRTLWQRMKIDMPIILIITLLVNFLLMWFFINKMDEKKALYQQEAYIEAVKDYNKGTLKAKLVKNDDGTTSWEYTGDKE